LKFIRGLIKNFKGQLEVQLKEIERGRTKVKFGQNQNFGTVHFLLYFFGKTGPVTSFAAAFNVPNVHQICQNLHDTDHQTSRYVGIWSSPAHWQINGCDTTPKRPTQEDCSCRYDNLTVHHAYFKPIVGILPNRIKGCKFFSCVDKIALFHRL